MLIALYEKEESYQKIGKELRRTPCEVEEKLKMMGYSRKKVDYDISSGCYQPATLCLGVWIGAGCRDCWPASCSSGNEKSD